MDLYLITDLIRQWWHSRRLQDRMHHDLPEHFREDWSALPWDRHGLFYGVLVPVIIHYTLIRMHEITVTSNLRKVISAQALVTGLFDDLFDRLHLSPVRLRQLIETPDYIISSDYIEEHLCQYLYRDIIEHFTGNPKALENSVHGIIKAQQRSFRQRSPDITTEEIHQITREKGGQAVLFYRSCIDRQITEAESDFLLNLGELFQMTNDLNDAARDRDAGEITLITAGLNLSEIRTLFEDQITRTCNSMETFRQQSGQADDPGLFSRVNILLARSLVTLDRYQYLHSPDQPFDIRNIPKEKRVSGLKLPGELRSWNQHYQKLSNT